MEKRISDLVQNIDVRANLSGLRQEIKENENRIWLQNRIEEDVAFWTSFLSSDDAKTRKNIALLLGDVKCQKAMNQIFEAYNKETTLFVKSAYLTALLELEVESILPELKQRMEELENEEITEENRKHIEEEKRELRKILIRQEGIKKHKFSPRGKDNTSVDLSILRYSLLYSFICFFSRQSRDSMESDDHFVLYRCDYRWCVDTRWYVYYLFGA